MAKIQFRHPTTNQRYTRQLFYDVSIDVESKAKSIEPLFTLHHDQPGLINFRKEYLKDMDATGYKTAVRLLEDYDHWQLLMKSKWFKEAKEEWDKELSAKMEAQALDVLKVIMKGGDDVKVSEQIAAAKALLGKSKTIIKEDKPRRGRPTKEEIEGHLKEEARLTKEEMEDLARIKKVADNG